MRSKSKTRISRPEQSYTRNTIGLCNVIHAGVIPDTKLCMSKNVHAFSQGCFSLEIMEALV